MRLKKVIFSKQGWGTNRRCDKTSPKTAPIERASHILSGKVSAANEVDTAILLRLDPELAGCSCLFYRLLPK